MSKRKKRINKWQVTLFDVLKRCAAGNTDQVQEGELDIANRVRLALVAAIKQCSLSGHQIASPCHGTITEKITIEVHNRVTKVKIAILK